MSIPLLIVAGVLVFLIALFFVYSASTFLTKKQKMSQNQKFQAYNKRFRFYYDFVLTRQTFRRIYTQVASLSVYNFLEARVTTVKFFERALMSAFAIFVIGFIGLGDIISGFVLMLFAFVMITATVNKRIDGVNFECLKATSKLILSMRECYTRVRNVPDAINDAQVPPILQRQVDDIYLICTANDAKERLNRFYEECPNRIIRTLATTCYIRADAGEDDIGKSPFKQGLGLVKDEVDMEVRRQINQNLMFNSLDKLPFIPLFLYPPIRLFYVNMISATAAVFESGTGYMIKLAIILSSFIGYYILTTINNASVARTDDRLLFIVNMMHDTRVEKFAKSLVVKDFKKRHILKQKIDGCLSQKTPEYVYLEKLVMATAIFLASIVFSIIILFSGRAAIRDSLASAVMSVDLTYTREQEQQVLEYDHSVLEMEALPPVEEMTDFFSDVFRKASSMEIETQVERLTAKYKNYHNLSFHWWYAFIYIACFLIGWRVPDLLLNLRVKLVKSEAEMDVLQLQTIIAILMDTNLDTMSVIYWLSKSSDIHKDVLTYCYHEYVRNPLYALKHLQSKSAIAEFSSMCDKLITTIHQVTLAEAFEDLIAERDNTMKVREVVQLEALKSKRNLAGPIATMPMIVWMVAAFILPIGIVAVRSAISMLGNLNM